MNRARVWLVCLVLGHDWQITPASWGEAIEVWCTRCPAVPEWQREEQR